MTTMTLKRSDADVAAEIPDRSQAYRVAKGGLVDRRKLLDFSFDGTSYKGFQGDTLASALLANGVHLVGRSFKYHRPRGILSAGSEEPNAIVELRTGARREPNTRATVAELYAGLEANSQNRWPSLAFDALGINALAAPIFAAGFYYKTFMWPASFWEKLYEPMIRRAAGLGRAANAPDPDTYDRMHAHCDVLVIGGGPAGLSAALTAGRTGARVILVDEDFKLGGRLLSENQWIGSQAGVEWAAAALDELISLPEVRILTRTTLFGVYDHGSYGAVERVSDHLAVPGAHAPRQRLWRITAKRAVLAAGAIERPHVFGGNDRPGVMLAGAVRAYVNRYGVLPGRKIAVVTSSDDGWRTVTDVLAAGGQIAAVIDTRRSVPQEVRRAAESAGATIITDGYVAGTRGHLRLKAIEVVDSYGGAQTIACDCLAMANGWNPIVHLDSHLSRKPVWNEDIHAFVPAAMPLGMVAAGAAAGSLTLAQCLATGADVAADAAKECGFERKLYPVPSTEAESAAHTPLWRSPRIKGKAFVDFQNDVAATDVELAHREGFRAVEHLKRYTTLGMATDQGKTSNLAGLSIMAELTGQAIPSVGTTVFRPPFTPVALGALAGHHRGKEFRATRHVPSHAWCEENGAVFVETGLWMRPAYFPRAGEKDWLESVNREVNTVRSKVGICDVTTLGKIDIQGRDALAYLEKFTANPFGSLPVGKARYAILLREDGIILDDGTIARMGENHYVMTASTANAAKVMQHMEFCRQWLWPEFDVQIASISEQWAQYAVAGPKARDTLRGVVDPEFDISNEAFPFLASANITVGGGIPARLFRISFSGELAYEIAVPAAYGDALWRAIMQSGTPHGITPYGSEALSVMRIEKGHAAGAEINGMTTAADIGLGGMLAKKKDYIGRLMKDRPGLTEPDRPTLVGVRPVDTSKRLRAGTHIIALDATPSLEADQGFLSSVAYSPSNGHWIGIGFISRGPQRIGERVRAYDPVRNEDFEVEICSAVFVDPEGSRMHV
ncbi:sarcosine oxidase subunit alpha family protein [Methylobacterium sp. C25]|uniref:sarcosine oxidase subunit alpha family protein n=1 Tax=Methylobacterium sp. C25 TaxID=2721622 RepID=UPI001F2F9BD5|nr:sarcosine oxidase subunit alpha family protein [Methylobacterium sp. C25]MCE4225634.1 sarcosine oxidase subunit alpha family protein [Methylobacterium sp. C25]